MKLTPPRLRALRILSGGPAKRSNLTRYPDAKLRGGRTTPTPTVYWQIADLLVAEGLARQTSRGLEITDRGLERIGLP